MPRPAGAHTAYRPRDLADDSQTGVAAAEIVTFTTDNAALLYAVRATPPMKYVYWPFGMSLADAIAADEAEQRAEREPASQHRTSRAARPSAGSEE